MAVALLVRFSARITVLSSGMLVPSLKSPTTQSAFSRPLLSSWNHPTPLKNARS